MKKKNKKKMKLMMIPISLSILPGAAAIVFGINETLTAYEVTDILLRGATNYKITDAHPLSPNRLLYIGGKSPIKDVFKNVELFYFKFHGMHG